MRRAVVGTDLLGQFLHAHRQRQKLPIKLAASPIQPTAGQLLTPEREVPGTRTTRVPMFKSLA